MMYFRLEHLLNELTIGFKEQEAISFAFGDEQNTRVTIRALTAEEKEQYKGERLLSCTAVTQKEPSTEIQEIFAGLAVNRLPAGLKKYKRKGDRRQEPFDDKGRAADNRLPSASLFPKEFQSFESELLHELTERIGKTVRIIRWRNAFKTKHNPTRFTRGVSWSFDNERWHAMPHNLSIEGGAFLFDFPLTDEVHREMEKLILEKVSEPLGHELFLEAWELRSRNPRSALIIGMSAAEVGFKQCFGKLVPDAEWLANNVPTPPLSKMLSEYLPLLPVRLKIQGRVLKPPKRIRTAIQNGTKARNETVHVGSNPPKASELRELLLSIRDLLYLLDGYSGFEWAFENLRDETKKEMIREFDLDSQ
jgi:hypothetical protein